MEYSITIQELIDRPIIRDDFNEEWMNKMTDEELEKFDNESYEICLSEGILEKYPDIIVACLSKHIDRGILYKLLKTDKVKNRRCLDCNSIVQYNDVDIKDNGYTYFFGHPMNTKLLYIICSNCSKPIFLDGNTRI